MKQIIQKMKELGKLKNSDDIELRTNRMGWVGLFEMGNDLKYYLVESWSEYNDQEIIEYLDKLLEGK